MPYKVTERLYVDKDDKVYRESELTERSEVTLLMSEGGELTDADAKKYGLVKGKTVQEHLDAAPVDEPQPEAKAVEQAPANKARTASERK